MLQIKDGLDYTSKTGKTSSDYVVFVGFASIDRNHKICNVIPRMYEDEASGDAGNDPVPSDLNREFTANEQNGFFDTFFSENALKNVTFYDQVEAFLLAYTETVNDVVITPFENFENGAKYK